MIDHMPDATSLAHDLQPLLPLSIDAVEFHAGVLTAIGDGCSLNLIGPWTWQRGSVAVTDSGQPAAENVVWDLCGSNLVEVRFPDPGFDGDCSFILSDGSLNVCSDRSGWETWTFRHDDLDVLYVGL